VGAWTLYGFHEDGFTSGIRAAERLGAKAPFEIIDARRIRDKARSGMDGKWDFWDNLGRSILILVQWILTTLYAFFWQKQKIE
jgi:hypothetical protein